MDDILAIKNSINRDIFDYQQLLLCLSSYSKPRDRIRTLIKNNQIVRIKKGLYIFGEGYRSGPVESALLANLIYGPSYVSLEYALQFHNLIPEKIEVLTSVCIGRSRSFTICFGIFSYKMLPMYCYNTGAELVERDENSFLIASAEKALADVVYCDSAFSGRSYKRFEEYLTENLRISKESLKNLDMRIMQKIAEQYKSKKVAVLSEYISRLRSR